MKVSEEHKKQIEFIDHCRANYPDLLVFRIPNDAKRSKINGYLSKRLGTVPGVPDTFIPVLKLFIEFKSVKGRLSRDQKKTLKRLRNAGYQVEVCDSTEKAIDLLESQLEKHNYAEEKLVGVVPYPVNPKAIPLDVISLVGQTISEKPVYIKIYLGGNEQEITAETPMIQVDWNQVFTEFSSWKLVVKSI